MVGGDVGFEGAGDLVADGVGVAEALAEVFGGDADGGDGDGLERVGVGAEGGEGGGEFGVDAGAVDDDDGGEAGDFGGLAPGGEVCQAVGSDQEEKVVNGAIKADGFEGFDAVMGAGALRLDLGDLEHGVAGDGDADHFDAVVDWGAVARFMGRRAGDDEPELVEREGLAALFGQNEVAQVDWVEGAAEEA